MFALSPAQLAAALAFAGTRPAPSSILPDLPAPGDPAAALRGTNLLDSDGRNLSPSVRAAICSAAVPARTVIVGTSLPGTSQWDEMRLVSAEQRGGTFVSVGARQDSFDLLPVGDVQAAGRWLNERIGLTAAPSSTGTSLALTFPALAVLLAAADALRSVRLKAQLARRENWRPVLTVDLLAGEILRGHEHTDTRWAVCAVAQMTTLDLRPTADQLPAGIAELERVGLLQGLPRGRGLTPAGETLLAAVSDASLLARLALEGRAGQPTRCAALFRSPSAVFTMLWGTPGSPDGTVECGTDSERLLRSVLEAETVTASPPPPRTSSRKTRACPSCGREVSDAAIFCRWCGTRLVDSAPSRFCPSCGVQTAPGKKFCTQCGASLLETT